MSKFKSSSKLLKTEDKEIEQLGLLTKNFLESLDKMKLGLAERLVNQERKIIDTYASQITLLKEKFKREFQEKVKK